MQYRRPQSTQVRPARDVREVGKPGVSGEARFGGVRCARLRLRLNHGRSILFLRQVVPNTVRVALPETWLVSSRKQMGNVLTNREPTQSLASCTVSVEGLGNGVL